MAKKLEYQTFMEEEGIELTDLPVEIRKTINVLKPTITKYNAKPSDKLKDSITKLDLEIAEAIADWHGLEDDYEEEGDDSGEDTPPSNPPISVAEAEANAQRLAEEELKAAQEEAERKRIEEEETAATNARLAEEAEEKRIQEENDKQKYSFGTIEMEREILAECNSNNGYISTDKLERIIKRTAKYPEQEVFSIKVRKIYGKSEYKLQ